MKSLRVLIGPLKALLDIRLFKKQIYPIALVLVTLQLHYGRSFSIWREIVLCGALAVDTFFFLSGFLVAHSALSQLDSGRFSLALFYLRRWIRCELQVIWSLLVTFGHFWSPLVPFSLFRLTVPLAFVLLAFVSVGSRPKSELEFRHGGSEI